MSQTVVIISGASGAAYGVRLVEILGERCRLIVTDAGRLTLAHECSMTPEELSANTGAVLEANDDIAAQSASGSADIGAVVICPASGTTIGKIAAGISE